MARPKGPLSCLYWPVCVTPNHLNKINSVRYAALVSDSAPRGRSSLSARQQDYVQLMHPYRALQPHTHTHSLRKGPHGRACIGLCVCVCACDLYY